MELIKLGKRGQITIPKSILLSVGISEEAPLMVEATADGAIVLRQVGVFPLEIYTDERVREFDLENNISSELEGRAEARLMKIRKK